MRIVFMGTPDFAVPSLRALVEEKHDVCCVFTQPDKPKGRNKLLSPPPVKVFAEGAGIRVCQPNTLKSSEVNDILCDLSADVIVVVAYGKILPEKILNLAKYGCINVHGSILPKYRGAAPIQWSVINGEKITGITTMYMDKGLDTGDIILIDKTEIGENETSGELYSRLSEIGAKLLIKTIKDIEQGTANRTKQKDSDATYAPILEKAMAKIDWNKSADTVHNLVRGMNPWPIAFTSLNSKSFKIYRSKISDKESRYPGEIVSTSPFIVGCGEGSSIELLEVQLEGKKRVLADEFIRGYRFKEGTLLGE